MRRLPALVLVALALAVAAAVLALRGPNHADRATGPKGAPATASSRELAQAAARRFLDRYVDPDGRVVRHDQDGDTVSEGQAYALLLAVAVGDRRRFADVWRWTQEHLQRPDGLLSFLWRDGEVEDPQAAADADLDAARALALAARRFGDPRYAAAAQRLAAAILTHEVVATGQGELLLAAGPWARSVPYAVNPSYFSPRAFALLERVTGDHRWAALRLASYRTVDELTADPPQLAPNWATAGRDGDVRAAGPPGNADEEPHYGFDAVRVPLRMAEDCGTAGHRLAARGWPLLRDQVDERLVARSRLDGTPLAGGEHPGAVVAAAAAANAAGETRRAVQLLTRAERLDAKNPTYYGGALLALGRVMLTTDLLGACAR